MMDVRAAWLLHMPCNECSFNVGMRKSDRHAPEALRIPLFPCSGMTLSKLFL